MRVTTRFALIALALSLAGCAPKPSAPSTEIARAPEVPAATYVCEDGRIARALYPDARIAQVTIAGNSYRLTQAVSGSGARYVGEGLQWWVKGDEAMLAPLKAGEEIAAAPGVRCAPPARMPVTPPAPGAPGGLPDDRTPLAERPAKPTSAQAAATVVETYYALLESGRTADAARLRRDGVAEDLTPLATLSAQVGRPGRIEGAAGSLYVEVPVVTYGRLVSGATFFKSGKAVLRRVNDVPGSTAEQRSWRIDRIDLTSAGPSALRPTR